MNSVQTKIENGLVTICVPLDLVLDSQENNGEMPLEVVDLERAVNWLRKNMVEYDRELGTLSEPFVVFLDSVFLKAYTDGEAWLKGIVPSEDYEEED